MRIMIDTNILISVAVFNSGSLGDVLDFIGQYHTLVLSSYILDELQEVVKRKFPSKRMSVDSFIMKLPFEVEYTPHNLPEHELFKIRDVKDGPILYSAITSDVDILITGDADFSDIEIERPEIMSPAEFYKRYIGVLPKG